jgi:hypothetical protein
VEDKPVTAAEIRDRIEVMRKELSGVVQRLDELVRVRAARVREAELGPHGRADVIAGRSQELGDLEQARELLESADDELAEARSLLG